MAGSRGLHPDMGLGAKGMVVAFVVFAIPNVEFANGRASRTSKGTLDQC